MTGPDRFPDDDALLEPAPEPEQAPVEAALLLTPVGIPEGLAAACALAKVPVDVLGTAIGAVGLCRDLEPGGPERAAQAVSRLLAQIPVVLLVRADGRLKARRWTGGSEGDEVPAALLLDGAPQEVEALAVGTLRADQIGGLVSSVGMSRWRAARTLAATTRAARRSRS